MKNAILLAFVGLSALTAQALTITAGDIYLDPTATDYGALRFKDFKNEADGGRGGNLYLQDVSSKLGSATGLDGRARVDGNPLWTVGGAVNFFRFEYRPVAGGTDLILAGATDRMLSDANDLRFSRLIDDPARTLNFISFFIQSGEGNQATADSITLNLTDLDNNPLFPSALTFGYPPGGISKWYLSDPNILANGFILQGNMVFSEGVEGRETDKVEISVGNFGDDIPVPDGGSMLAMLGVGFVGLACLKLGRGFGV